MNRLDLEGKIAVVTGGGSGIGKAIVHRFVASGAKVHVWDVKQAAIDELGKCDDLRGSVSGSVVDVRRLCSVHDAATQHDRIDILVNSAGVSTAEGPTWECAEENWNLEIDVNLNGVFRCCREVAPIMIRNGYGRIINIASVAGKDGNPFQSAYGASKAGVIALTKALGVELAMTGVIVNCVTPGLTNTTMGSKSMQKTDIAQAMKNVPMGRVGEPEEIAALVGWLSSSDCSYSTGAAFDITGGRSIF